MDANSLQLRSAIYELVCSLFDVLQKENGTIELKLTADSITSSNANLKISLTNGKVNLNLSDKVVTNVNVQPATSDPFSAVISDNTLNIKPSTSGSINNITSSNTTLLTTAVNSGTVTLTPNNTTVTDVDSLSPNLVSGGINNNKLTLNPSRAIVSDFALNTSVTGFSVSKSVASTGTLVSLNMPTSGVITSAVSNSGTLNVTSSSVGTPYCQRVDVGLKPLHGGGTSTKGAQISYDQYGRVTGYITPGANTNFVAISTYLSFAGMAASQWRATISHSSITSSSWFWLSTYHSGMMDNGRVIISTIKTINNGSLEVWFNTQSGWSSSSDGFFCYVLICS